MHYIIHIILVYIFKKYIVYIFNKKNLNRKDVYNCNLD